MWFQEYHNIFSSAQISYEIIGTNASHADFNENGYLYFINITEYTEITIKATVILPGLENPATDTVEFTVIVEPPYINTFTDFFAGEAGDEFILEGYIAYICHSFMYITDLGENQVLDRIILVGTKEIVDGRHQIAWGGYIDQILGNYSPLSLTVEDYDLTHFTNFVDVSLFYKLIRTTGKIVQLMGSSYKYGLQTDTEIVPLDFYVNEHSSMIQYYLGQQVEITVYILLLDPFIPSVVLVYSGFELITPVIG